MLTAIPSSNIIRRTKEKVLIKDSTSINIESSTKGTINRNQPLFTQPKWPKIMLLCITSLVASLYFLNFDFNILLTYILPPKPEVPAYASDKLDTSEASNKDEFLGINFPYFGFNVTRDIEAISQKQYDSNNEKFTDYTSKFSILRIRANKIEYLTWKPVLTSTLTSTHNIEYEEKYPYQPYDRHARMSLTFLRNYWYPSLMHLQSKLRLEQSSRVSNNNDKEPSIIIPLNLFSSAIDVWEAWIGPLSQAGRKKSENKNKNSNFENSIFFSYCMPQGYLYNSTKYHSYLIPRYYTDPRKFFGFRGNGDYTLTDYYERDGDTHTNMLKFFDKFAWENRGNKAVFRGSLTNPWRYELFKIFNDNQKYYERFHLIKKYKKKKTNNDNNDDDGDDNHVQDENNEKNNRNRRRSRRSKRRRRTLHPDSVSNNNDDSNEKNNIDEKNGNEFLVQQNVSYITKYDLADYMDISLTNQGQEPQFENLDIFRSYIINTPILHRVMPTKELVSEIFDFIKEIPQKFANALTFEEQIEKFKYVIHIDGWTCAGRLQKYLTAGFVVIWLRDDEFTPDYHFIEDWYLNLKPYVHYVPVQWGNNNYRIKPQLDITNEKDIKEMQEIVATMAQRFEKKIDALVKVIKYLQDNDDIAKRIALNAREYMRKQYTRGMINERIFDVFDHLPIRDAKNDGIEQFLQNSPLATDWKLLTFLEQ